MGPGYQLRRMTREQDGCIFAIAWRNEGETKLVSASIRQRLIKNGKLRGIANSRNDYSRCKDRKQP